MQVIRLNLSKIPKERIFTSEKTGDKSIDIVIDTRKEADQYGNDLTVYLSQTKEERENKTAKTYLGSGKTYIFQKAEQVKEQSKPVENNSDDDLPF